MDAMTRDLVIRLRWIQSMKSPLTDEMRTAKQLAREAKQRERDAKALGLTETRALRERWREAQRMGLAANRQEREDHRRRLKDLAELKARRAEAMGMVRGFGSWGMGTAMVGGALGAAAGVGLTKNLIDEARGAQNEWLGMTTLINSADSLVHGPLANINAAFNESRTMIEQLREAARLTPGTFDDISAAFRDTVIPARMAGAEYKEIIKLATDMSTMTKVLGFDPTVVSQDVRTLLRGDSADIITPQLNFIREEVAGLAKSGQGARALARIQQQLAIHPLILGEYSQGFDATLNTLTDEWRAFAREAGKPVLSWLTNELKEANKWLGANKDEVKKWAKELGQGVVDALVWIKDALKWVVDNGEQIIGWAKWLAGAAGLAVVVTAANGLLSVLTKIVALGPALKGAMALTGLGGGIAGGAAGKGVAGKLGSFGILAAAAAGVGELAGQWIADTFIYSAEERAANAATIEYGKETMGKGQITRLGQIEDFLRSGSRDYDLALPMYEELKKLADYSAFAVDGTSSWAKDLLRDSEPAFEDFAKAAREAAEAARGFRADLDAVAVMTFRMPNGKSAWGEGQQWLLEKGLDILGGVREKAFDKLTNTTADFRGSRFNITQRIETDNPAALARVSLLSGLEAVAKRPIRAKQRPGSVRLANGDRE